MEEKRKYNQIGLRECKCAVCGKSFIPAPMHVYKRTFGTGGHTKWLCSYHCLLEWDREHKRKYTSMK